MAKVCNFSPLCFLPLGESTPQWMSRIISQHQLKTINPPPFEQGKDRLTPIYLDYPLLNQLALLSGHSEIEQLHLANIDKTDISALQSLTINWFVLPKTRSHTPLRAYLDQHLTFWKEDEQFIVWRTSSAF